MFGIGWAELLLIVAVSILVIGPKEIPSLMYGLGRIIRRLQYVRFALSQQFEDFLKEHDLEELRRGVNFEAPDTDEAAADEELLLSSSPAQGERLDDQPQDKENVRTA